MKKTKLILFLSLLFPLGLFAQRQCASMEYLEQQQLLYPEMIRNMEFIEQQTRRFAESGAPGGRTVVSIPVVVNVIYRNPSQNVSDEQVFSQIQVLTDDFRRMNADADATWPQAADTEIDFCLANVDPDGNPTTGIRRRQTTVGTFSSNNNMKFESSGGLDAWPTDQYLNIWVCDLSGGLLGYAQFPGGNPATDGIVVDYQAFGIGGTAQVPFHLGRTATHEVGHWLNLRHIWGDGGCGVDDFVADTPTSDAPNFGCALGHISCGSVDMVQNYMDYSNDACMNLFTAGQKVRMQALFAPGGARAALLNSPAACGAPPLEICNDGIDNDGDGLIDCDDPDCAEADDCRPTELCFDGIDNDGDGLIDCDDPDCAGDCVLDNCDAPTGLASTPLRGGLFTRLTWNAVDLAVSYTVEVRQIEPGTGNWSTQIAYSTGATFGGLTTGNTYEWRVKTTCGAGSGESDFTTATFVAGQASRFAGNTPGLQAYPNPSAGQLWVAINIAPEGMPLQALNGTEQSLQLTDLTGRVLLQQRIAPETELVEINATDLPNGLYLIRLTDQEGRLNAVTRVVISR